MTTPPTPPAGTEPVSVRDIVSGDTILFRGRLTIVQTVTLLPVQMKYRATSSCEYVLSFELIDIGSGARIDPPFRATPGEVMFRKVTAKS